MALCSPSARTCKLARLFRRIGERAIYGCVASVFDRMVVGRSHPLNHRDEDHVVGWIDPEPSSGGTVPEKRPLAVRQFGLRRIKDHGYIETVAEAASHHVLTAGELPGEQGGREVIGRHELDDFWRENTLAP